VWFCLLIRKVPKVLLEAMVMRKPFITNDASGCKMFAMIENKRLLIKLKDIKNFYYAMKRMLQYTEAERKQMGGAGRKLIVEKHEN